MSRRLGKEEREKLKTRLSKNEILRDEPLHEAAITIMRPAMDIYNFWRDYRNLPKFMKHLKFIEIKTNQLTHWRWTAFKDQIEVAWDSEILQDIPGSMIAWHSVGNSHVTHEGVVSFEEQPFNRGTVVRIQLAYDPPGGEVTHFLERITGESPEIVLRSDLHRLRQLLEVGELPTIQGQPHGGLEPRTNPSIHH